MTERTPLHLVDPVVQLCRLCPALVDHDLVGDLCARCLLYRQLDAATGRWTPQLRSMLAAVIAEVLTTTPPDDVGEFWALVAEVCCLKH